MSLFSQTQTPEEIVVLTSRKIAQELRDSEPETKTPLDLKKISGIKRAAPEIQKYIEDIDNNETPNDDIIIGGSSAAFTQIKKGGFRTPKDLDLSTPYLEKEVRNITQILKQKYGAPNVNVAQKIRVIMGGKDVDVVQIKIKNKKGELIDAVDIKQEVNTGLITVSEHPKTKIGKLYVEPIGYLIQRKTQAIKEKYADKIKSGQVPRSRAKKDINDFRTMVKSVPDFQKKNLQIYLTEFEKSLIRFNDIPETDPPQKLSSDTSTPFGLGNFFAPSKRKNPLHTEFKLW